jgi:hypothetical protein
LREIFLHCIAGGTVDLDPVSAPLLLRDVSSAWRDIADSTPGLWNTISVTPEQVQLSNVKVLKEWVARSGITSLLDISFHAPLDCPNPYLLAAMLAELMPTSHRWRNVSLSLPVAFLPMLLSNSSAPLPALESLELIMDEQPQFTIDSTAIHLRSVSLVALPPLAALPKEEHFDLMWEQITHLNIQTAIGTLDSVWDVIFQCPQLLSLVVAAPNTVSSTPQKYPFNARNLFHSGLQQLTMSINAHPDVVSHFLDGLYLHNLRELQLIFTDLAGAVTSWPKAVILDLRKRCLPPLARIAIAGKVIPQGDLVHFVREMRHLEQLEVICGMRDFVTPPVRALLPQDNAAVLQRRSDYLEEVRETMFVL